MTIKDNINPDHYRTGGLEVIDILKAKLTPDQLEGFLIGNVLKYTIRYPHKNGVEDLKKAQWYLNRAIEEKDERESKRKVVFFSDID